MPRPFTPKVVTANDLVEGDVVYLGADGQWVRALRDAKLIEIQDQAEDWLSRATARTGEIVGAYLADAKAGPDGPEPVHFREAFRARGPSNYLHGKQENAFPNGALPAGPTGSDA